MGIDIAGMVNVTRQGLAEAGLIPAGLRAVEQEQGSRGTVFGVGPEQLREAVEELRPLVPSGATLAQLALRWILMFDAVTCAIPATTRVDHMLENGIGVPARDQIPHLLGIEAVAPQDLVDQLDDHVLVVHDHDAPRADRTSLLGGSGGRLQGWRRRFGQDCRVSQDISKALPLFALKTKLFHAAPPGPVRSFWSRDG